MTLTDFLLARIAEDEAVAKVVHSDPTRQRDPEAWFCGDQQSHVGLSPARVLAECEAKRRLVEMHEANDGGIHDRGRWDADAGAMVACRYWFCCICDYDRDYGYVGGPDEGCETLRTLALPYADHADYREAWRP